MDTLSAVERLLKTGEAPAAEHASIVAHALEHAQSPSERSRAAKVLGELAPSSPLVATVTLPFFLVTEKSPDVREAVALAIGAAGESAMGSSGRCALQRATSDSSAKVRAAAQQALLMVGWLELLD